MHGPTQSKCFCQLSGPNGGKRYFDYDLVKHMLIYGQVYVGQICFDYDLVKIYVDCERGIEVNSFMSACL